MSDVLRRIDLDRRGVDRERRGLTDRLVDGVGDALHGREIAVFEIQRQQRLLPERRGHAALDGRATRDAPGTRDIDGDLGPVGTLCREAAASGSTNGTLPPPPGASMTYCGTA